MKMTPLSLLLALGATTGLVAADVTTVITDRDNTLFESPTGALSNGSGTVAFVGTTNMGNTRRTVLRFDVASAIPAGSTINSVTLQLQYSAFGPAGPVPRMQAIHRVTQDWGEGASSASSGMGATSQSGDATWIHTFFSGSNWTNAGGDFMPTATGTITIPNASLHAYTNAGFVGDVQDWLDNPTNNFGWLIKDVAETNGSATSLYTHESAFIAPQITIDYTPGGPFGTFCDPSDNNSTGVPTVLTGAFTAPGGSLLHLEGTSGPATQFGYILVGTDTSSPGTPVGAGHLCLDPAGTIGRYNFNGTDRNSIGQFDASGVLQNLVSTSSVGSGYDVPSTLPIPGSPTIMAGQTWHFQLWHREDGMSSNFSNGLSVTF